MQQSVSIVKDPNWLDMARQRVIKIWCMGEGTDGWKDKKKYKQMYWWMDRGSNGWTYEMNSWLIIWMYRLIGTCNIWWKNHAYNLLKYFTYDTTWNTAYRVKRLGTLKNHSEEDYESCRNKDAWWQNLRRANWVNASKWV